MRRINISLFLAALLLAGFPLRAADPTGYPEVPELKGLKYRSIGPAWGGRITRAIGVPGDPSTYYAGTASGGVWKSVDGGYHWKPIFDDQTTSSIGSIALSPANPHVLYVGAGEANIRGNVAAGDGIYKSTDGGKTWTHVWKQIGQIGTMVVHPTNPDIALAAVLGHAFGPNPERGVYRTRDGGKTWEQVLKKDENTGASDVAMDGNNPNILFAGLWQARRLPWEMTSGGPGSGLYRSRDGGDTWTQLTGKGLPAGIWGKVGVAVAPSDSRRVYALIEAEEGGLFRSDDGGDTWKRISANRLLRQRAWYYSTITVHPKNADEVWIPNVPMLKSIDGGATWKIIAKFAHGDHHDLWIDPAQPRRMINGNDGGVEISLDGGETWFQPPLPIGQFYHISVDNRNPFHVAGSLQDIGTAQGPSDSLSSSGIGNTQWYGVGGGEAGWVVSDPTDPNIVYAGEYGGIITYYDHRTRQARNVSAYPENPSGHGGEDLKYRFQWTAPIHISPHNPKTVYHGANVIFKTVDGGRSWTAISGDLSRNDKSKQKWSGGPITGDNTGVEIYGTVFVIAESPRQPGLIWAGTDDGLIHLTRDGGKTWTDLTAGLTGLPEWSTIRMIEPSRTDAATAWVVADNHRQDDPRPYLYRTNDYGQTFTRLDGALPPDVYLHVIRQDPVRPEMLYLGTERGVAFSTDHGASWKSLRLNLPTVAVHDIAVKGDALVLGTMGRSAWILDHLQAVRELSPQVSSGNAHLFSAAPTTAWRRTRRPRDRFTGEDPPAGASLYYWLKEPVKSEFTLEILDSAGAVIRKLSSQPKPATGRTDDLEREEEAAKKAALSNEAGINRAVWDLRYEGAKLIPKAKIDMGDPSRGPFALPGAYTARLLVDGKAYTTALEVLPDPRVNLPMAARQEQLAFALAARDSLSRLTAVVERLRSVRDQLQNRNKVLAGNPKAAALVKDSTALIARLDALEARLHNPSAEVVYDILAQKGGTKLYSRLGFLYAAAIEADGAVPLGAQEVYADQKKELDGYESEFKKLMDADLTSLNLAAQKLTLPIIVLPDWQ